MRLAENQKKGSVKGANDNQKRTVSTLEHDDDPAGDESTDTPPSRDAGDQFGRQAHHKTKVKVTQQE